MIAEMALRPAVGAVFVLLDGRSVLFSERRQEIYELDQVGHSFGASWHKAHLCKTSIRNSAS